MMLLRRPAPLADELLEQVAHGPALLGRLCDASSPLHGVAKMPKHVLVSEGGAGARPVTPSALRPPAGAPLGATQRRQPTPLVTPLATPLATPLLTPLTTPSPSARLDVLRRLGVHVDVSAPATPRADGAASATGSLDQAALAAVVHEAEGAEAAHGADGAAVAADALLGQLGDDDSVSDDSEFGEGGLSASDALVARDGPGRHDGRLAPPGAKHPSLGSEGHHAGKCRRCCFFSRGRCANGYECRFCHYVHEKPKQKRKRRHLRGAPLADAPAQADAPALAAGVLVGAAAAVAQPLPSVFAGVPPFGGFVLPSVQPTSIVIVRSFAPPLLQLPGGFPCVPQPPLVPVRRFA